MKKRTDGAYSKLEREFLRKLTIDWVERLAREAGVPISGWGQSSGIRRLTTASGEYCNVTATERAPFNQFVAADPSDQKALDMFVVEAWRRAENIEIGGDVWYVSELSDEVLDPRALFAGGALIRSFRGVTIDGWRRIGAFAYLRFEARPVSAAPSATRPVQLARLMLRSSGPLDGLISRGALTMMIDLATSLTSFALGRPAFHPVAVLPANSEEIAELEPLIGTMPQLARRGTALDVTGCLEKDAMELFRRYHTAYFAFDAALKQSRDEIAVLLFIAAADALSVPNAPWRHDRVSLRFRQFYGCLLSAHLDGVASTPRLKAVFGMRAGARAPEELREKMSAYLYRKRSGYAHQELPPFNAGMFAGDRETDLRFEAQAFAEAAILEMLRSPQSCLTGHPTVLTWLKEGI